MAINIKVLVGQLAYLFLFFTLPLFIAALLFLLGTASLLGSGLGLLIVLIFAGMIAVRAVLEERTLQQELQGYDAYMAQVKYRLIPLV